MKQVALVQNPVKGLDVSHYDATIDFAQVKAAGYEFCWAKATEGLGYIDKNYHLNRAKAQAAGLLFGAYHFFRPGLDPVKQAEFFMAAAKPARGDLRPMFDWEVLQDRHGDPARAKKFLDRCEASFKCKLFIYGSPFFLNDFGLGVEWKDYPLIVADYAHAKNPRIPSPWSVATGQQFTDKGAVPGIPAPDEDLDYFNGTLENLRKFCLP